MVKTVNQFKVNLKQIISKWPGYQHVPDGSISFHIKLKTRVILSVVASFLRLNSDQKSKLRGSRKLHGKYSGAVLVLANGPSVNSISIPQIVAFSKAGGKIAVMNGFHLSNLANEVTPDFYFLMDPSSWNSTKKNDMKYREDLRHYITMAGDRLMIVQPVVLPDFHESHQNIAYVSPLNTSGLIRFRNPFYAWGMASSTMLVTFAAMKVFGFQTIYFGGVDGSSFRFFAVNDLNQLTWHAEDYHFYERDMQDSTPESSIDVGIAISDEILPSFTDMLYAEAILRRDFKSLSKGRFINISGGEYSDLGPRVCLVRDNFIRSN